MRGRRSGSLENPSGNKKLPCPAQINPPQAAALIGSQSDYLDFQFRFEFHKWAGFHAASSSGGGRTSAVRGRKKTTKIMNENTASLRAAVAARFLPVARFVWCVIAGGVFLVSVLDDISRMNNVMLDRPAIYSHLFLGWIAGMSLVGYWLGGFRGQPWAGACWGLVLGPLGWLISLVLEDRRPRCAACYGLRDPRALVCPHCRRTD